MNASARIKHPAGSPRQRRWWRHFLLRQVRHSPKASQWGRQVAVSASSKPSATDRRLVKFFSFDALCSAFAMQ
jgi:hypothetical protein